MTFKGLITAIVRGADLFKSSRIEDSRIEISVRLLTFETPILSEKSQIEAGV